MTCKHCGEKVGVIMVGARDYKDTCNDCKMVHYGGADKKTCQSCGSKNLTRDIIAMNELIPGAVCDKCKALVKEHKELLMAEYEKVKNTGAIMFLCEKCGSEGLVKGESGLAQTVRAQMKIPIPDPCGVKLPHCPNCKGDKQDGEDKSADSEVHN
jgi:hypothetical protein